MTKMDKIMTVACVVILLLGVATFTMLKVDEPEEIGPDPAIVVLAETGAYLAAPRVVVAAADLSTELNDGIASDDPFILDIRSSTDFALGHIPGAINIPYTSVFVQENLDKLPTDNQIVVVCYTGHTASQITALLNTAGYDAIALKFGFESWFSGGKAFNAATDQHDYALVTGTEPGVMPPATRCGEDEPPADDEPAAEEPDAYVAGDGNVSDPVLNAANLFVQSGKPAAVKADALYATLTDGDASNDPFLLSIRGAVDYEAGHVPGAVNMAFGEVFNESNLALLPTDRQIVVICYTGHTASQTMALLNINGFDATALKWGFESWSNGGKAFDPATVLGGRLEISTFILADEYMDLGKSAATSAAALNTLLTDADATNDPFVLDIRGMDDFVAGHIPGAINVPYVTVFETDNLAKLPNNIQIVVVCYTGHTASQTTALLNLAGYDAIALKWGFEGWSSNGKAFDPATSVLDGTLETGTVTLPTAGAIPSVWVEDVAVAADEYMALGKSPATSAATLDGLLSDTDATNDPFILDIRGATDFEAGHIAGAVNIAYASVFDDSNKGLLPTDTQIVVVCYTGHTASQTTALLNMAGYNAIALKWGFEGWSSGGKAFDPATSVLDGAIETGGLTDLREISQDYLDLGKAPATTATALQTLLDDADATNDPYVLDIRGIGDFIDGHIPGAINIPFREVFEPDNLAMLPTDIQIVVVCYTGHTASQITALLNTAGYDAIALKWGFEGWADGGKAFDPSAVPDYTVSTGVETSTASSTGTAWAYGIDNAANDFLALGKGVATTASALHGLLNDADATNDPFILDIRGSTDYEAGHVPGAINIPYASVFTPENIVKIPLDIQVVVVCYTGHTASQITALLGMNDFDAIALKWGFEGWADGGKAFDPATSVLDGALDVWFDLQVAANDYMALGKSAATSADSLRTLLADGNASNDPYVLDIRGADDYEAGHIPTAVNIGYTSVFTPANQALLPTDRQIVVVCYTGHTASQTTAMLNMAGFDAIALKWGFEGWSDGGKFFTTAARLDGELETQANDALSLAWETVYATTSIAESANDYLALGKPAATSAATLNTLLTDADASNDPFILDIRTDAAYTTGHVPGAVNIGYTGVFTAENITLLPKDKQIVVVCFTGHTASQTTAMLNMNGFDAIALKWGFEGWSDGGKAFSATADHELVTGTAPGVWP